MTRAAVVVAMSVALLAPPRLAAAAPPAELRAAPARAELPGKPTGPIAVEHRLAAEPAVGVALEVAVTARVESESATLSIAASASSPRTVLVTPPLLTAVDGGVYSWTVSVVPLAADAGYLSIIVAGNIDGVAQARTVTISLRSAAGAGAPASALGRPGETLIALPVQESP